MDKGSYVEWGERGSGWKRQRGDLDQSHLNRLFLATNGEATRILARPFQGAERGLLFKPKYIHL